MNASGEASDLIAVQEVMELKGSKLQHVLNGATNTADEL